MSVDEVMHLIKDDPSLDFTEKINKYKGQIESIPGNGTAEEKDHEVVSSRGFQLEWCYTAFAVYFQYEYCLPKIGDIKGNNFYMIDEHSLEYRSLGLGLRFKF